MSGSDYTRTPNLGLYKPNYALDVGQWGNHLNLNSDTIDTALGVSVLVPPDGSIQTAINGLPSTGGVVTLSPNTTYVVASAITVNKPNVTLVGQGWNTILKRDPSLTLQVINATAAGFVARDFTVDGNAPLADSLYFEIQVAGADSLIEHCQVINSSGGGAIAISGAHSRATGNTVTGLGSATDGGYGIWALGHDTVTIDHNTISGTQLDAIGFDGTGSVVEANRIFNCQCNTAQGGGQIALYGGYSGAIVSNNTIDMGGASMSKALELNGSNIIVMGNTIQNQRSAGCVINANSGDGIVFVGNLFRNNGQSEPNRAGIELFGPLNNVTIMGNNFIDDQTTPTQFDGIFIAGGYSFNRFNISGNTFFGNINLPVQINGTMGAAFVFAGNTGVSLINAANDAAAATAGVLVGVEYRNGSAKMVRVA